MAQIQNVSSILEFPGKATNQVGVGKFWSDDPPLGKILASSDACHFSTGKRWSNFKSDPHDGLADFKFVVWNMCFFSPIDWEFHHPNSRVLIFFRGVGEKPPTSKPLIHHRFTIDYP